MPKKYLFYITGMVLLVALGFYGYIKWTEAREKVDLWTLVPDDAVFVIESGNHEQLFKSLDKTQVWQTVGEMAYFRSFRENLVLMDSIAGGRQELQKFLNNKNMLTSVHIEGNSTLEMVFYLPVSTVKEHRFLRTLGENLGKNKLFRQTTHDYEGYQVTDLKNLDNGDSFSHFTYRNNLIMSQSPVILEEIIRKIVHNRFESVAADYKNTNYLNQEKVFANVFVNYHNVPPFMNLFFKPALQPVLAYLSGLCRNSMLEFKLANNKLYLNGFSNPENASQSFYQHIVNQKPQTVDVQKLIPNRTAALLHFGLTQPATLRNFTTKPDGSVPANTLLLADTLSKTFSRELALAYLQTFNPAVSPEKVVFAYTAQPAKTLKLLEHLNIVNQEGKKSSVFSEKHGRFLMKAVTVSELPALLFGKVFSGFNETYYVLTENYLVMADNAATLRSVLDAYATDKTWEKTVSQKKFLEETQHQATFSLFLDSENAWDILNRYVKDEKKASLLRNENLIKGFSQFAIQFSNAGKQYYTTVLLRQPDALAITDQPADTFEIEKTIPFNSGLIAGPFPVRNPVNQSLEHLVQDSTNTLFCLAADGSVAWTDSLTGRITGDIKQEAFGSDGKTKYLFATAQTIHCLDRKGKETEGFPLFMSDSTRLQHITVVDWKKNGRFTIIADDADGNLFQFNEFGDVLNGWQPKNLNQKLAAAPQLFKAGNTSVLVAVLENGYVYAVNESGETLPGFPLSVKASVKSGFYGQSGANLRRTECVLVTDKGEVITFNLEGEIIKRHQLIRPDRNAVFELIPENSGKSYLIARQSQGRISLFNPEFRVLFERNFFTSSRKLIQYFLFGGDKIVYAITETGTRKSYLFNGKAQPIGNRTIESKLPVSLFYDDVNHQYELYKVFKNTFRKIILKN